MALAVAVAGFFIVSSKKIDEETLGLPATWTATMPSHGELWENAEINLNPGGKASLTAVPVGEIAKRDGRTCLRQSSKLYSGEAEWVMGDESSVILVKYPEGGFPLVADAGKFGSVDWLDAATPFCDGSSTATYGRR
ncbi:hypothetical protein [Microbacterium esteraromaticum]|uniref:hypothetical protein n=1 Tax=Microbacterium esteraromaticum TaxID=57043 RepID=UPI00195DC264|nr:hypothetical protein [Microbacterium esteraromaticum]MBM7466108.1 hypothetical protein [Microbacterium esteraromaticum]